MTEVIGLDAQHQATLQDVTDTRDVFIVSLGIKEQCRIVTDPETLTQIIELMGGVKGEIIKVLVGKGCKVFLIPDTSECGADEPGITDYRSSLSTPNGGIIVALRGQNGLERYDVQAGTAVLEALAEPCEKYPEIEIGVLGLKLKPKGETGSTTIETTVDRPFGDIAEVYMQTGTGEIQTVNGNFITALAENMRIRVNSSGKLVVPGDIQVALDGLADAQFQDSEGATRSPDNPGSPFEGCSTVGSQSGVWLGFLMMIACLLRRKDGAKILDRMFATLGVPGLLQEYTSQRTKAVVRQAPKRRSKPKRKRSRNKKK